MPASTTDGGLHEEGTGRLAADLPAVFYDDASKAIDWLCQAFGFEVQLKMEGEGGRIEHSELKFGEGLVMVSTLRRKLGAQAAPPGEEPPRTSAG